MTGNYSEQQLIERAAIEVFESLGYTHQNCYEETFGSTGTLGRETSMDVVLVSRLKGV
jgi:type I restriction enzyme R subunit